jgi:hypothetical protein
MENNIDTKDELDKKFLIDLDSSEASKNKCFNKNNK